MTEFVSPLFAVIDETLARGQSVLLHCWAGAHRAGTTACLCLMHYHGLDKAEAVANAQSIRSVIDPKVIPQLNEFLEAFARCRDRDK